MKKRIARLLRRGANRLDPPAPSFTYTMTTSTANTGNFRLTSHGER